MICQALKPTLLGVSLWVLGCDSAPPATNKAAAPATKPAPDNAAKPAQDSAATTQPASVPVQHPALPGTVVLDGLYVHTCVGKGACPPLLQDKGSAHCAALTLGGLTWRLPTLAQLQRFTGEAKLVGFDVFHWSSSAWDEDPAQFWIFDPGSGSKTTARPDRKPFTIRCVAPVSDKAGA